MLEVEPRRYEFAYDYRSRRVRRKENHETHCSVYDGGLAVQEDRVWINGDGSIASRRIETEYIRGEGMGGGVGGMVYSIKPPAPDAQNQTPVILCSHANHRGDVIARSNMNAELTSFALYEAYGTRPYEWGSDPDRQKANTKEEEKDLGLLFEGMRIRNLYDGTFMTRDPSGYKDGANLYCYVHCNPITHFDALGLETGSINPFSANFMLYNAVRNTVRHYREAAHQVAKGRPDVAVRVIAGITTSQWSGDLYDSPNSVLANQTAVSHNGVNTGDTGAKTIATHTTEVTGQETHAVQNGTHGMLRDLIQCASDSLGIINTPSLNSADAKREIAQKHGSRTIESTAFSQGTSTDRGGSVLLDGEGINERTSYQGLSGQATPRAGVYKDNYNERGPNFIDNLVTHADPRGWFHQGNYITNPDIMKHSWESYGKSFMERAEQAEEKPPETPVPVVTEDPTKQ